MLRYYITRPEQSLEVYEHWQPGTQRFKLSCSGPSEYAASSNEVNDHHDDQLEPRLLVTCHRDRGRGNVLARQGRRFVMVSATVTDSSKGPRWARRAESRHRAASPGRARGLAGARAGNVTVDVPH